VFYHWIPFIVQYFDERIGTTGDSLFETPIRAFQIGGKRVEMQRTGHAKTYTDFIQCSRLPKSVEVCFIDDVAYKGMQHDRVYFIQPPPYHHGLTGNEIAERFIMSDLYQEIFPGKRSWREMPISSILSARIRKDEIDVFHRILYYLNEFFFVSFRGGLTKKHARSLGKFTRKKKRHSQIRYKHDTMK
jgi:hypothetical protein